ncbi:hypothetical protein BASA83_013515 [Batrachochytrium salamandrivorans]|nr:hypothetical protein BASA83_013515 [Batrachochytrium salamandrivorans]
MSCAILLVKSCCTYSRPWYRDYFGEDETTGGGGANVFSSDDDYLRTVHWSTSQTHSRKSSQEKPRAKILYRVTVGARQLVRGGNYAGELVEDNGVKSDVIVRSNIADILPGDRGASNYDRIANYLGDVAKGKRIARSISYLSHMIESTLRTRQTSCCGFWCR